MRMRPVVLLTLLAAMLLPGTAGASELIDRNATNITLQVNGGGRALLGYQARGRRWRVLAWGATNARHPAPAFGR